MKDIPLSEITLRKYEKPYNIDKRQLVKKICLSLGLLQPGDGRDVIVDILLVLLEEKEKKNAEIDNAERTPTDFSIKKRVFFIERLTFIVYPSNNKFYKCFSTKKP